MDNRTQPIPDMPGEQQVFPGVCLRFLSESGWVHAPVDADTQAGCLHLHYCHAGRLRLETGPRGLESGEIWVVPPGTELQAAPATARYAGVSLLLHPGRAQAALEDFAADCQPAPRLEAQAAALGRRGGEILSGTEQLRGVFAQLFAPAGALGQGYYRLKTIELLLYLASWRPEAPPPAPYLGRYQMERAEALRAYLEAHPDCRLTQAQLAQKFHMSLTALKRAFQGIYGCTLHTYMRRLRMEEARRLLLETDLPVSEIAGRVGYESHSQFTAVFHAWTGETPGDYRRARRRLPPARQQA